MEQQNRPMYSVVIPTYNEEARKTEMEEHLESIRNYFTSLGQTYEVVVVLDGPTDKTPDLVKEYAEKLPNVRVIDRKKNRGKGFSIREGFLAAEGQIRLWTDMDGATPINMLDRMIPKFQEGADVVVGSRDLKETDIKKHQPKWKEWAGDLGNLMIQFMTGLWGVKDTQCGFKAFNEKVVKDVVPRLTVNRWGIDFEILMVSKKLGYKIQEVPVEWHDSGSSLVGFFDGYLSTLQELFKVRVNLIFGVYKLRRKMEEEKPKKM